MLKKQKLVKGNSSEKIALGDFQANPDLLSDEQTIWDDRAEQNEQDKERIDKIKAAMHVLTPNEFTVVTMLANGHKYQEIANELNTSVGNIVNYLNRAQNKIRKFVVKK